MVKQRRVFDDNIAKCELKLLYLEIDEIDHKVQHEEREKKKLRSNLLAIEKAYKKNLKEQKDKIEREQILEKDITKKVCSLHYRNNVYESRKQ